MNTHTHTPKPFWPALETILTEHAVRSAGPHWDDEMAQRVREDAILMQSAPELMAALEQATFALESVLMLAGGSLRPAAVRELVKYADAACAAIAKAKGGK